MATHKNIDRICIAVTVISLLLTVLFMNGERLGIKSTVKTQETSSVFTSEDLDTAWAGSDAVKITLADENTSVSGGGAFYADGVLRIAAAGKYVLSGSLADGSVVVEADSKDKVYLLFDGVSVRNETGAALTVRQADKVILTLAENSENDLSCGENFSEEQVSEGADGVVYACDDLTVNGDGALSVTGDYKHGIVCNDDLVLAGGSINITAREDAVHANDSIRVRGTELVLEAGDDGLTASNDLNTSFIYVESGKIDIASCYEGLEACVITVNGGEISVYPTDDGLNATDGEKRIEINGGSVSVINKSGRDADGFDSNGDIIINGGNVFISVPGTGTNCALDFGSENGGKCLINGGTVAAFGGRSMAEGVSSDSAQAFIMKEVSSYPADSHVVLTSSDGERLISADVPSDFGLVTLSAPGMEKNGKYIFTVGEESEEMTADCVFAGGTGTGGFPNSGHFGGGDNKPSADPDGEAPFMPNGEAPSMPDGERPAMPDGEAPSMPDGEAPSMPDRERPSMPDGERPSMPDGERPSMPDGERPAMSDGKAAGTA